MLNIINLNQKKPRLQKITIIKQILPLLGNSVVIIGHSLQSLKLLQFIFQIYDFESEEVKSVGTIDAFGVRFLTQYVPFKSDGQFMNLTSSTGQKFIRIYDFVNGTTRNYIKSIETQHFQINPKNRIIIYITCLNQIGSFLYKAYPSHNNTKFCSVNEYRIINLNVGIPKILLHGSVFGLLTTQGELSIYDPTLQAKYYFLENIQSLTIICLHHELIVSFKQSKSVFMLTTDGSLKSVVEDDVISVFSTPDYLYFLISRQQKEFLEIYQYKDSTFVKKFSKQLKQTGYRILGCNKTQAIIQKS